MKIKHLLLVSLLGLPLIACGGSGGGGGGGEDEDAIYKVNKEEFFNAIGFKDELYLQEISVYEKTKSFYAPDAFYKIYYNDGGQVESEYKVFKNEDNYTLYRHEVSEGKDWEKDDDEQYPQTYFEPIEKAAKIFDELFDKDKIGLTYEELSFDSKEKMYFTSRTVPEIGEMNFRFCFKDKKLISYEYDMWDDEEEEVVVRTTDYSHEEIEIDVPVIPDSLGNIF